METTTLVNSIDLLISSLIEQGALPSEVAGALQGRVVTLLGKDDSINLLNYALASLHSETVTQHKMH